MFCNKCGTKIEESGAFCAQCGARLELPEMPVAAPTVAPAFVPPAAEPAVTPAPAPTLMPTQVPAAPAAATPVPAVPAPTPAPAPAAPAPTPAPAPAPVSMSASVPAPASASPVTAQGAVLLPMQDFVPVAPPGQGSPANEAPKKRSKKPFIIAGGIVGVILIVIIAVVISTVVAENNRRDSYQAAQVALEQGNYQEALDAFIALGDYEGAVQNAATCQKYLDYTAAQALMDGEQYADALAAFEALRGFEDADALANECQSYLDYDAALGYLETKDYAAARDAFELLAAAGFLDADVQLNKANYALADAAFNAGELETAYNSFTELGDFEDSATRAAACLKPLPSSGELYHNDSYRSSACPVAFEAGNSSWPYYLKIYDGETLVSTLFITAGGSASISLPAGYYTFKTAHGTLWFGEDIMFGENGSYSLMLFDDGNDYAQLENNYEYTITLYIEEGGNVGNRNLDMTDF